MDKNNVIINLIINLDPYILGGFIFLTVMFLFTYFNVWYKRNERVQKQREHTKKIIKELHKIGKNPSKKR